MSRGFFPQDLRSVQNIFHQERPDLGSVGLDFRIDAVFSGFAPGFIFRVGTTGEMTEVRSVGADPNSVGKSARRQVRAQTLIDDLDERRDILDVVTRYAATDCKNAETLGRCHQLDKHSAVALKIDQNWSLAAAF